MIGLEQGFPWKRLEIALGILEMALGILEIASGILEIASEGKKCLYSVKISRATALITLTSGCLGPACHMLVLRLSGPGI